MEALLKNSQVTLPAILLENDVNQKACRLNRKTEKLGLPWNNTLLLLAKPLPRFAANTRKKAVVIGS